MTNTGGKQESMCQHQATIRVSNTRKVKVMAVKAMDYKLKSRL
ncbi:hypothetical protein ABZR88_02285 [Mucilaginibacter yixingensis]